VIDVKITDVVRVGDGASTDANSRPILHRRIRGMVLFMGLIFLVMLSLTAIVMMRGTLLETRMTTATARHEQALEASEALRVVPEALLTQHVYNRGWPESWGGNVPDEQFDLTTIFANRPAWIKALQPSSSTRAGMQMSCGELPVFYVQSRCENTGGAASAYYYTPSQWQPNFVLNACVGSAPSGCDAASAVRASIAIVHDGELINAGEGAAQAQGYAGEGVGAASGGGAMLFEVRSEATVPGGGSAITIGQYKISIEE
jgi:hypothetical protein